MLKKLYLQVCLLLGLTTIIHCSVAAQAWQTPAQAEGGGNSFVSGLRSVFFVNTSQGWAVGTNGVILSTNNGGATWKAQASGVTANLLSVYFISPLKGWVSGSSGILLTTSNGGNTWTTQTTGVSTNITSVFFASATHGWFSSTAGVVRYTTNGGSTWTAATTGIATNVTSVFFTSTTRGWLTTTAGGVRITNTGGVGATGAWTAKNTGSTQQMNSACFINDNQGWVVGNGGTIYTTSNGGDSWTQQTSGTTQTLNKVHFINANQGWAVGNSGVILATTDGGSTWTTQTSGVAYNFFGIYLSNANQGCAVGNTSTILTTGDAGTTWGSQITSISNAAFYTARALDFVSPTTGWAAGGPTSPSTVYKTTDGGATWTPQLTGGSNASFAVDFVDASNGWVVDFNGKICRTTDGGSTWAPQYSNGSSNYLNCIKFANSTTGWAAGFGYVVSTTNSGSTWTELSLTGTQYDISVLSATQAWIAGTQSSVDGGVWITTDGTSWTYKQVTPANILYGVSFASATKGWAVGSNGLIFTTNDGGNTWTQQTSGVSNTLYGVHFASTTQGWVVGTNGLILTTNDGGSTWFAQSSGLVTGTSLMSVAMMSPTKGMSVANNGAMTFYDANLCNWVGSTSTNWTTTSNWSGNALPTASSNVYIPANATNQPTIGSGTAAMANTLTVQNFSRLTLSGTGTLNVSGAIKIKPNAALVGSSANITYGSLSVQQAVSVQRGWRVFANPFTTATNIASTASANGITISTTAAASGLTDSRTFDNSTNAWTNVTASNWASNTPYALFMRGLTSEVTGSSYSTGPSYLDYTVSGTMNGSSTTVTPSMANNFLLVGNPYLAPVTSSSLTNGAGKSYYVYQISQGADQTAQRTKAGSWSAVLSSSATATIPVLGTIAYQPSSTAAYNVTVADINTGGTLQTGLFRNSVEEIRHLELVVNSSKGEYKDKLFVRIGTDNNKMEKLANDDVNVYTFSNGQYLAVDARKELGKTIPLGIGGAIGSYNFTVANHNLANTKVYLKDKLLGNQTELLQGSSYGFDITTDANTKGVNRFELVFEAKAPALPQLVDMQVKISPNPVKDILSITGQGSKTISVINLLGQVVKTITTIAPTVQIPVSNLQNGLYLVEVKSYNGSTITEKIIKN